MKDTGINSMSKYKRGHQQSVDKNELEIIKYLEDKGYFIVRSMDDFLIYLKSGLVQVEVKNETPFNKNGTLKVGKIKDSQYKMLCYANSAYVILWSYQQAHNYLIEGFKFKCDDVITPLYFREKYKEWLTDKELKRLRNEKWFNL